MTDPSGPTEAPVHTPGLVPAEHTEVLRDEISTQLTELAILLDLVHALLTAPQRSLLGFLSPEARQALNDLVRDDLHARRSHIHDGIGPDVGLRFMNADHAARGAASPAPLTLSPAAFEAQVAFTLQHLVKTATHHLVRADQHLARTAGICTYPRPLRDDPYTVDGRLIVPGTPEHAARLRILTWEISSPTLLETISRDLGHLLTLGEEVVDGADRYHLGECPHCGRDTLVVHFRNDDNGTRVPHFARCEKDPATGHHERCLCESAWCDCKTKPVTFRHTWWHSPRDAPDPRVAHDWHDLANRLTIHRATKEPTP